MTGIKVPFPIIADRSGEIARKYGMIATDISNTETVRNVFIIDDKGIVRTILVYPMNVGRWIPEILRIVQALQVADNNKASTPANWIPCNPVIMPIPTTFDGLMERRKQIQEGIVGGMNWYLGFKNPDKCSKIYDKVENSNNINHIGISENNSESSCGCGNNRENNKGNNRENSIGTSANNSGKSTENQKNNKPTT